MRAFLIHLFSYVVCCFIGTLQFVLLSCIAPFLAGNFDSVFTNVFGIAIFIFVIVLIMSIPIYLVCVLIITNYNTRSLKFYIICGMITASSFFIYSSSPSVIANLSLKEILAGSILPLMGILPGLVYYKLCKYFFDK